MAASLASCCAIGSIPCPVEYVYVLQMERAGLALARDVSRSLDHPPKCRPLDSVRTRIPYNSSSSSISISKGLYRS